MLGVDDLGPGDLIVTEVMVNPTCVQDTCEWIELFNATAFTVDLQGLLVQNEAQDPGNQGSVDISISMLPGTFTWMRRSPSGWPYQALPAATYGPDPLLQNAGDRVRILNSAGLIDETPDSGGQAAGFAWQLDPDALDGSLNDDPARWCAATSFIRATTNRGTPGTENVQCD